MKRARLVVEQLFQRQVAEDEDASLAMDRMAREIQGSVFALLALFLLVSLTSYLPLDTINIFQGRLDQVNNFAGIVGALVAEALLGSLGLPGYSFILLVGAMSAATFARSPLGGHLFKIAGTILGTALTAVLLNVLLTESFPEVSLWQGGWLGRAVGGGLRTYFNTGGALLLLAGGYLVTFILTTGLSLGRLAHALVEPRANENETDSEDTSFEWEGEQADASLDEGTDTAPDGVTEGENNTDFADTLAAQAKPARKRRSPPKATASVESEPDTQADSPANPEPSVYRFRELIPYTGAYQLPTLRLLKNAENTVKRSAKSTLKEKGELICQHLQSFQITGDITAITEGPVLTTYEFKPAAGVKLSKIANLQDDLGVLLGTNQLRVVAPIPGKTVVGIEVPRAQAETIALKEVLSEDGFFDKKLKLPVALGKSTDGVALFGDLAAMPHLLVAGATGSGKSVFMNSLIMSFLFRLSPQQLRMILIDPKMLEFAAFSGLPHLVTDVITDNKVAINAMNWAVTEMDRRYALMAKTGSKNIESYNSKMRSASEKIPYLVVVVDELADLMMSGGEEVEVAITRLAQKARAAGIHLVIATQRPSAEVVTGLIKANVPSRISFKVPSGIDSRTILDTSGAEELIGRGDSLMIQSGTPLRRVHGTFVTEEELARVVKNVKGGKSHTKSYISFAGMPEE